MSRVFECSRVCVYLAVFAGVIGCAGMAAADLITNGDFTADTTGWGVYGDGGWNNGAEVNPSPNGGSIWCAEGTWLQQKPSTALDMGQTYEVSFSAAIQSTTGEVNAADETLYTHVNSDANGPIAYGEFHLSNTWQQYSYQFTPTVAEAGGGYGVAFLNNLSKQAYHGEVLGGPGQCQFAIDNVSLTPIPEPSVLGMSVAGLAGLLAYAWRKRR
jgi:hypothetical protein